MDTISAEWIVKAVDIIKSGIADKLEKDNVKVYRVPGNNGNGVIRVDVKEA